MSDMEGERKIQGKLQKKVAIGIILKRAWALWFSCIKNKIIIKIRIMWVQTPNTFLTDWLNAESLINSILAPNTVSGR